MKQFFIDLISPSSPLSSKRFISIFSLFLLAVVIVSSMFGVLVPNIIYYVLTSLITGSSVMTLFQPEPVNFTINKEEAGIQNLGTPVEPDQTPPVGFKQQKVIL